MQHLWEKKIPVFLPTPRALFCSAYSKVCIAIFGQTLFRSLSCIIEVKKNMHIDPPCSFFKNINRNAGIWPYQHLKIMPPSGIDDRSRFWLSCLGPLVLLLPKL